jgi:hypothetical protein
MDYKSAQLNVKLHIICFNFFITGYIDIRCGNLHVRCPSFNIIISSTKTAILELH